VTLVTHHPVIPVEKMHFLYADNISKRHKRHGQGQMLRVGDIVRLKAGGPEGRVVRTSPGNKYRVAWKVVYYSNHSPARLMLVERASGETGNESSQGRFAGDIRNLDRCARR
jgi:uncharacterized protein YodC (DUF2158 family)